MHKFYWENRCLKPVFSRPLCAPIFRVYSTRYRWQTRMGPLHSGPRCWKPYPCVEGQKAQKHVRAKGLWKLNMRFNLISAQCWAVFAALWGLCRTSGPDLGNPLCSSAGWTLSRHERWDCNSWNFMMLLEDYFSFYWQDANVCESWISFTHDP